MSQYGYYSSTAAKKYGSVQWETPSGNTVEITYVGNTIDPKESGYLFNDATLVGEVTKWVSGKLQF